MLRLSVIAGVLISACTWAQNPGARQKALNNFVAYANQSSLETASLFNRVEAYYSRLTYFKKQTERPSFTCPDQLDEFYFKKAITGAGILTNGAALKEKAQQLKSAAEQLDVKCKALDTYHKLEDYQRDQFRQADQLINDIQVLLKDYRSKQNALVQEIEGAALQLQTTNSNAYQGTDNAMKKEIYREKAFLDQWTYNFNATTHTGWPVDKLPASILETDKAIQVFKQQTPALKYPASSMYGSFTEGLGYVLNTKRAGLDGYNFDAKQSDKHSNQVYLDLINYYNGVLVADHNTFVQFSERDGYYGVECVRYVPGFEIRTTPAIASEGVKPFEDKEHVAVKVTRQATPVPKPVFAALGNYIEFINEGLRQADYLIAVLRGYNSSARYYKDLTSFKGKGGLTYSHEKFEIPQSLYQTATVKSEAIPAINRKTLNTQAEVILNILKEMDELSIALASDCKDKAYEKDNLKRGYEILERYAVLFNILDDKKEQLYRDVRAIYESYPVVNPAGSWAVSNKALLRLVDEDKVQLFTAKSFCKGDTTAVPTADAIDAQLREVISNEFTNMKGIERLGRYNGLCPYTPYEDVPANSRTFGEKLRRIKTMRKDSYRGPYNEFIYLYNVIAEDYNKFCELAKVDLLKTVIEPDLFVVKYPEKKTAEPEPVVAHNDPPSVETSPDPALTKGQHAPSPGSEVVVLVPVKTHTETHDTVYIEKHDTIYMNSPAHPTTMDGFAANNLVFLLDVSGSMSAPQRLPLLKKSMIALINKLRPEDRLSIVVYSGGARVILQPTSAEEKEKLIGTIEALNSDGQTDAWAGIQLAYKVADQNYIRGGNNRIILATDGDFAINNSMTRLISRYANMDIFLTVFAFGNGDTQLQNLARLASTGRGHYENVTTDNSDQMLLREAQGRRK